MSSAVQQSESTVSLTDHAYGQIKNDIIFCNLEPGSEVTESAVGERYGLGKAPVRAALARLVHDGLVSSVPRRGYRIAPITPSDIHECMAVRLLLEPEAARLAAERMSTEAAQRLRTEATLVSDDNPMRAFDKNRAFHLSLATAGGNQRLASIIADLVDRMERIIRLLMHNRGADTMKAEFSDARGDHEPILAAIESGDGAAAEAAMRQHLATTRSILMDVLFRSRGVELRMEPEE